MRSKLLLFDIDGTILRDGGDARDAFAEALEATFGTTPPIDRYDFSGRTDPEIAHMVLGDSNLGRSEIDSRLELLWNQYLEGYSARAATSRSRLIEGIPELLEELVSRDDVALALLTGNIERGARLKLSRHDLNGYFPVGAFGSDSAVRSELPPIAVSRASTHYGASWAPDDVYIIGDSIHDVRCGRPHGVRTVAVATGRTPIEALEAERPDLLVPDLTDPTPLFEMIRGADAA